MGMPIQISEEVAYATKGNVAHPGTSAQITAAQTKAVADLNAHLADQTGSSVTVSAAAIVAAR